MKEQEIKLSVDAVVFGYEAGVISVLLIKRKYEPFQGKWAIPGGFVQNSESLEEAVTRELKEETGISIDYLEQLYTFGKPKRDPRSRVVSVAYFGLVKPKTFKIFASTDAEEVQWFNIQELPTLSFDHAEILKVAITRLQNKITYEPIGFELLDGKFPFSDLEKLYTTLLGRSIDRRNFRKKIMGLNVLDMLDEKTSKGSGRPANLFKFNQKLHHIKPHGALYNVAAVDEKIAKTIIEAIKSIAIPIKLYVPYKSVIADVAIKNNIAIKYEAFADRNYNDDLTLVSRAENNALINDEVIMFNHVYRMISTEKVKTINGVEIAIKADTFCIHGDNLEAVNLVKDLRANLEAKGIKIV